MHGLVRITLSCSVYEQTCAKEYIKTALCKNPPILAVHTKTLPNQPPGMISGGGGRTLAPSASADDLSCSAVIMGWSGLISSVLRPFMYSDARVSPSVCAQRLGTVTALAPRTHKNKTLCG